MDKKYKKEGFEGLKIKSSVAKKFRSYCRSLSRSQSMTLQLMLDFFQDNNLSPHESLGTNMTTLEGSIKKRINALIAIVKDIEKNHHKPTTAILQSLFEQTSDIEKKETQLYDFDTPNMASNTEELDYYRSHYFDIKAQCGDLKHDLETIIKSTKYIKSSFGNSHYRLELSKGNLENLKQKLKDVYNDNQTGIGG